MVASLTGTVVKKSMLISVCMMCLGSLVIACLPGYETIGTSGSGITVAGTPVSRDCQWGENTEPVQLT